MPTLAFVPTWAALNDDPQTGDSISVAFLELEGRTIELRTCFVGAVPPTDPVEGRFWRDSAVIPYRLQQYLRIEGGGPSCQPFGPLSRLLAEINADPSVTDDRIAPFEFKALRIETLRDSLHARVALMFVDTRCDPLARDIVREYVTEVRVQAWSELADSQSLLPASSPSRSQQPVGVAGRDQE